MTTKVGVRSAVWYIIRSYIEDQMCPTEGNQPGVPDFSDMLEQDREEAAEAGC